MEYRRSRWKVDTLTREVPLFHHGKPPISSLWGQLAALPTGMPDILYKRLS
jgi:hypothetical protein